MRPLGQEDGAARRNSGDLASDLGRGVLGEALWVAGNRLGCWFGEETIASERHGGGRRRGPLELGLRRAGGSARATQGWGSHRGS
jgi:hypothetical protein